MNLKKWFGAKLNKKGFTLVEIVCALAILAIVGVVVVTFIKISTDTYSKGTIQVDMQYDAQQSSNQIKNIIMEANAGVAWFASDGTSNPFFVVYNYANSKYELIKLEFDMSSQEIRYGKKTFDDLDSISVLFNADNVMAKHVTSFFVDTTKVSSEDVAILQIAFSADEGSYSVNSSITLRNKIVASENTDLIYGGGLVETYKEVKSVKIIYNDTDISSDEIEITKSFTGTKQVVLTGKVEAYGFSKAATWSLENSSGASSIDNNGVVTIGSGETAHELTVKLISTADNTKYALTTIKVDWPYLANIELTKTSERTEESSLGGEKITWVYEATPVYGAVELPEGTDTSLSWDVTGGLDNISYSISGTDKKTITIVAESAATGQTFSIQAKSSVPGETGGAVASIPNTIIVPELRQVDEPMATLTFSWGTLDNTLSRNMDYHFTADLEGVTYRPEDIIWSISDNAGGKIKATGALQGTSFGLRIDKDLPWDSSYTFTITVSASGTKDGVGWSCNSSQDFIINPVTVSIDSPSEISVKYNNHVGIWSTTSTKFDVLYSIKNIANITDYSTLIVRIDDVKLEECKLNSMTKTNVDYSKTKFGGAPFSASTCNISIILECEGNRKEATTSVKVNYE